MKEIFCLGRGNLIHERAPTAVRPYHPVRFGNGVLVGRLQYLTVCMGTTQMRAELKILQ